MIKKTVVALSVATLATGAMALPEAQARDISSVQVATCSATCNLCSAAACNPCSPCATIKPAACNPCNPCAAAGCNPCNPCNPCAASN